MRHRFPRVSDWLRRLRDVPCGQPDCRYCRETHDPTAQLQRYFGFPAFRSPPVHAETGASLQQAIVQHGILEPGTYITTTADARGRGPGGGLPAVRGAGGRGPTVRRAAQMSPGGSGPPGDLRAQPARSGGHLSLRERCLGRVSNDGYGRIRSAAAPACVETWSVGGEAIRSTSSAVIQSFGMLPSAARSRWLARVAGS